ncbi:type II toxin-antitoxin system VapC family toxin [Brevundimonas sp. FT23042]|uniref:type II toxin-antitoxin system VapC family toxin n=1 Tax=Brevundimonas sp. FT23042 TaxID=3393749 RepID=UPI003B58B152
MTVVVLDASAALAWILPSQATTAASRLLEQADEHDFIAPDVFLWEVANVLITKARSGSVVVVSALDQLDELKIDFDHAFSAAEVRRLVDVAAVTRISLFDAAYLALAMEQDAVLASRDGPLLAAATAAGLPVFDLRG